MIETGKITNFILLIKEELRENIGGILAMVIGVLAALYTIWLTLTYLPAEPFPSVVTPTPITAAPSYLLPTPSSDTPNPTLTSSSTSRQGHIGEQNHRGTF